MTTSLSVLDATKFSELAYIGASKFNTDAYRSDPSNLQIPSGWTFIDESDPDPNSYYYGVAFKNDSTAQVVIASRGTIALTDPADAAIAAGHIPWPEFNAADKFYNAVRDLNTQDYQMWGVGHSKAGGDADYLATQHPNFNTCTLNAPGIANLKDDMGQTLPGPAAGSSINDFAVTNDVVGNYGMHYGTVGTLPGDQRAEDVVSGRLGIASSPNTLATLVAAEYDLHSIQRMLHNIDPSYATVPCNQVNTSQIPMLITVTVHEIARAKAIVAIKCTVTVMLSP